MAAVYESEFYRARVGITDLSQCTDIRLIDDTAIWLRDEFKCDMIILSNTSPGKVQSQTNLSKSLNTSLFTSHSSSCQRRCIPFKRNKEGAYIFQDVIVRLTKRSEKMNDLEIWRELRMRPFKENRIMDDNLGWAPGLSGIADDTGDVLVGMRHVSLSSWTKLRRADFSQIREWYATGSSEEDEA